MYIFTSPSVMLKDFILFIGNIHFFNSTFRAKFYSKFLKNINIDGAMLRKNITLYGNGTLFIGKGTLVNEECFLDCSGDIYIEEDVAVGMRTSILTSTHRIGDDKRCGEVKRKKTVIKRNSWIGANVIIYPGVTIGSGCVISAGEVVDKDIEDNMILKNKNLKKIIPVGDKK